MHKGNYGHLSSESSQAGFTIIESLVALLVAALLLAAIAPVLVLSTATRVQARRVELAIQAAKTYIDGVSAGTIPSPSIVIASPKLLNTADPPTKLEDLYCVDLDGGGCSKDSTKDLGIQAFRTQGEVKQGYGLALRVYRADAFKDSGSLKKNTADQKVTQSTFTGGLGDRKAPLLEMTTEIVSSDSTFKDFCNRLQNSDNKSSGC